MVAGRAAHVHQHDRATARRDHRAAAGSWVSAETSLTIAAPASRAAAIVAAFLVSTEILQPAAASALITGRTRACSSSG